MTMVVQLSQMISISPFKAMQFSQEISPQLTQEHTQLMRLSFLDTHSKDSPEIVTKMETRLLLLARQRPVRLQTMTSNLISSLTRPSLMTTAVPHIQMTYS